MRQIKSYSHALKTLCTQCQWWPLNVSAKKCVDNRDPAGVDATDPAPSLEPGAECDEVQAVLGDRDGRGQQAARGLLHGLRDGAQQRRGQADCGRAGVQQARGLRQHHSR